MTVHVLIPWRDDDGSRREALSWIGARWNDEFDLEPVLGELASDSDWCKADAVQVAIRRAGAAPDDVLVIADADVWCTETAIADAIEAVASGRHTWALPHGQVHRLTEPATRAVYAGACPENASVEFGFDRAPYLGVVGGGMTVILADQYASVPLDPRFVGWGQEDEAWGDALRCLAGTRHRANGQLWHLWHPPAPRMTRAVGNPLGEQLRRRYQQYVRRPELMRGLIDGGRSHLATG